MKKIGIIPARMASSRFPGKPMKKILGIPMIEHCYVRSKMCLDLDEIYVATCDQEIYQYINSIGGKAVMTSNVHERATERAGEALLKIEKKENTMYGIVIMIQGDEPLVHPQMLSKMITPLINYNNIEVTNLMVRLYEPEEISSADIVKVVVNHNNKALYMSREAIPSNRNYNSKVNYFRQLGLIAFKRDAIINFISLDPTKLEIIESVDMNRFLENDITINMIETNLSVDGVDTPQDLIRVEKKMKKDELYKLYKSKK
jgi:3-deoxy-manno-octulosonate cytidylyltransferase (CMP-KDO synthetase)